MSTKTYDRQTGKFLGRVAENMPEMSGDVMQGWINNPKGLQKFLLGLCTTEKPKEDILDFTIHVDRTIRPTYPDWSKVVTYPDLEPTGPTDYNLSTGVEQWLHDGQKDGKYTRGQVIYDHLKETDDLKNHLSLRDLEEIQKKGIKVFRMLFKGKAVFAWKSVVQDQGGHLGVPFLYEGGDGVLVYWHWLDHDWGGSNPALRFAS